MATGERPRWRVNTQSFVGHALVNENDEVYYTPPVNLLGEMVGEVEANLSPLNDAAQAIIDAQKTDHPDKASNAEKRERAAAAKAAEVEIVEKESTDGPVKAAKGDVRSPAKPAKGDVRSPAKPAKGKKAATEPAADADEDIG
jgi:hypothetical protein